MSDVSILVPPDARRRYWRGDNGGATYTVVAPSALVAMMYILQAEHSNGCTDDITELSVVEMQDQTVYNTTIRGDGEPSIALLDLPMGEVACSEWP